MSANRLATDAENTWCKGCGNFGILSGFTQVLTELERGGVDLHNIVIASGIGCHAKIVDYLNINSFYCIHGRVPPVVTGMKLANRSLTVVGFAGDGDAYGEGLSHLIMSAKRNIDVTMIIHDNRVYGLTTGQFTPTSPKGFKGRSTPRGSLETPINPILLMLCAGATFVARCYSGKMDNFVEVTKAAINHKGFAFIDVLQPCFTFFNTYSYYNSHVYMMEDHDPTDFKKALEKATEWDMTNEGRIPLGIFYRAQRETFDELVWSEKKIDQFTVPDITSALSRNI
ncbi:MAG: thiamine pyrophosphate-dependent enzyme [bacterium]